MTADNVAKFPAIPRAQGGLFAPGNPGRPKGAKGKKSREALEQVKSFGPEALQKLWEAVAGGERWAVEFVLEKIMPTSRTMEWEDCEPGDIREALKNGDISAAEAKDVSTALAKLTEIGELAEIRAKLAELERAVIEKG